MTKDPTVDVSMDKDNRNDSVLDPMIIAGLAEQLVDLKTVAPRADVGRLTALREVFADRGIIGIGEASHGVREFFRLKHRLIRFLVEELGVRLFAFEASFTEALAVDRFIRRGEGDPEVALEGLHFRMWETEELLALVKWLRAFNTDRPPEDQVRFYGFDMQFARATAEAIMDYLDCVDSEYLATVHQDLAVLADHGLLLGKANGCDRRLEVADRVVSDLRATLEECQTDYVARCSERAWKVARQQVTVLRQATEFSTAAPHPKAEEGFNEEALRVRDRAMAENVAWMFDQESTERIAVWAHNDHVNKVKTTSGGYSVASMGRHLAQRYGAAYYALGFEFGCGTFQAFAESEEEDGNHVVQKCSLDGPLPDTVGSVFTDLDPSVAFLDFRTAKADSRLTDWLHGEHRLHWIGSIYDPEQLDMHVQPYVLAEAFDGLCYVDETTPTRLLVCD